MAYIQRQSTGRSPPVRKPILVEDGRSSSPEGAAKGKALNARGDCKEDGRLCAECSREGTDGSSRDSCERTDARSLPDHIEGMGDLVGVVRLLHGALSDGVVVAGMRDGVMSSPHGPLKLQSALQISRHERLWVDLHSRDPNDLPPHTTTFESRPRSHTHSDSARILTAR